jgi:hypothetical protein
MADFTIQVTNFEKYGTFNYQFDEAGNIVLNPSSSVFQQNYFSLPLVDANYNTMKLLSFYDPTFTEFVKPTNTGSNANIPSDIIDQINSITAQNQQLQDRLDVLIVQSETNPTDANTQVVKDIIVALRIQLGQGSSLLDFETDFPYLPIPVDQRSIAP